MGIREYENTGADLTIQTDSEGSGKKASEREKRESMDGEKLSCDSRHLAMAGNERGGWTVNEWMMIGKDSRKTRIGKKPQP